MMIDSIKPDRLTFPGNVFLVIDSQIVPLKTSPITLGRNFDNDVIIQNDLVSRKHALILYEHGTFVIYDKQSTGGTYVNNQKVVRCVLNSGDLIQLAKVQIMFVDEGARLRDPAKVATRTLEKGE
ncbi:MAG: FHA domain-containing protein [Anaerolineae bacterium]|nr:FHA domain-containing protein [Anaerolineae bacterium]